MCLMTHQGACGNGVNFSEVVIAKFQTGCVSLLIHPETGDSPAPTADCFLLLCGAFHYTEQKAPVSVIFVSALLNIQNDQQHNSLLWW